MPTNKQIQLKIAEVQGWDSLFLDPFKKLKGQLDESGLISVPNWPGDRNASYELPVEDVSKYARCCALLEQNGFHDGSGYLRTSRFESLAWLFYKGRQWVECDCEVPAVPTPEDICPKCNGEGGEWVKIEGKP
ncbi:hypothetical protein LCGC14_0601720 [marine sediment metagenome]|uniref:Uncharacterized protein n=1 Tax=marine sediment metagenome TaxID=412755 RepID=A0A0F9RAD2_9ZZZZ|nr:hypothetical protein [Pricia sp.]